MVIDPTITFGALLNAGLLCVGLVVAFVRIGGRIDLLTLRIVAVEEWLKASREVSDRLIAVEERQTSDQALIAVLTKNVYDMQRGDGFVIRGREYGPPNKT